MNTTSLSRIFLALLAILFVFPTPAHAHQIGGNGFASGITHPLLGLDHLLAMVAVGIISTQIGKNAVWKIPATFIVFMILGGVGALFSIGLPFIETSIAVSVLVLGAGIAVSRKFPLGITMLCVAFFALFHGHAHGEEMPTIAHPAVFALGFVLSTTILHIAGVIVGHYAKKTDFSRVMLRVSGAAISLAGIYFLFYR